MKFCRQQHITAPDGINGSARQIEGNAIPLSGLLGPAILGMEPAHPCCLSRGRDQQPVVKRDAACKHASCHHGSCARKRKDPVDRQTKGSFLLLRGHIGLNGLQRLFQPIQAKPGRGRDRDDGSCGERSRREQRRDFLYALVDLIVTGEISLAQRHDSLPDIQQIGDHEMLARLRHDAVIGRNNQEQRLNAGHACQHVVHIAFVTGHIDKADAAAIGL